MMPNCSDVDSTRGPIVSYVTGPPQTLIRKVIVLIVLILLLSASIATLGNPHSTFMFYHPLPSS